MPVSYLVAAISIYAFSGPLLWAEDDAEAMRSNRMKSNDAIARHNAETLQSFLDDDLVITISTGPIKRGREEHGNSFAKHFEKFPDVVYLRTPVTIVINDI